MLTETRQISNLTNQDVSKEIQSDLVRKNVAEFSDKFQYATREMCKRALNNYSMLKLRFFLNVILKPTLLLCIVKTSPISIMRLTRTPNDIFYCSIAPN